MILIDRPDGAMGTGVRQGHSRLEPLDVVLVADMEQHRYLTSFSEATTRSLARAG